MPFRNKIWSFAFLAFLISLASIAQETATLQVIRFLEARDVYQAMTSPIYGMKNCGFVMIRTSYAPLTKCIDLTSQSLSPVSRFKCIRYSGLLVNRDVAAFEALIEKELRIEAKCGQ